MNFTALADMTSRVLDIAARPSTAIVLIPGPKGSGRTTSLRAIVRRAERENFRLPIRLDESNGSFGPLLARPIDSASSAAGHGAHLVRCHDDLERELRGKRPVDLNSLEENLRAENQVVVTTTSVGFALHLFQSGGVPLDTAMVPAPRFQPTQSEEFRGFLLSVQKANANLFAVDLTEPSVATRLLLESAGFPGLLFRQLHYAEALARSEGRDHVQESDLNRSALEAFKLRMMFEQFEQLSAALDNSRVAWRAFSSELKFSKQQELALGLAA